MQPLFELAIHGNSRLPLSNVMAICHIASTNNAKMAGGQKIGHTRHSARLARAASPLVMLNLSGRSTASGRSLLIAAFPLQVQDNFDLSTA
jgi:hypothetical protein